MLGFFLLLVWAALDLQTWREGFLFEADDKWLWPQRPTFFFSPSALALVSSLSLPCFLSLLLFFAHTNSHTNKAADAARGELIQADRTQWHPWHFRGRPAGSRLPKGAWSGSGRQISLYGSGWLRAAGRGQWAMHLSSHFCQRTGDCEMKTSV